MALYLGSDKVKINLNGIAYGLNLFTIIPTAVLLSSDNYILTDLNGVYLLPKDYMDALIDGSLASSDSYILADSSETYLIIEGDE